jgi:hypothetical protein
VSFPPFSDANPDFTTPTPPLPVQDPPRTPDDALRELVEQGQEWGDYDPKDGGANDG